MHFVTEEFLANLQPSTTGMATDSESITEIWVNRDMRRFDIELISELSIAKPGDESAGYSDAELNELRGGLVDRVRWLRRAFRVPSDKGIDRGADLLVSCGDLSSPR